MSVESLLKLDTLSESGTPPKSRIANASDASAIADAIIYGGQERSRLDAEKKGMFDGNPPYNRAKLRQEAQAWRANVNFLEGKAASSAALVPFYDLFAGAKYYAQVRTNQGNEEDKEYWSEVITEEFDRMLKRYNGFDFNMQQMFTDLIRYGRGLLMWPDATTDWWFKCVPQHKAHVPNGTDANAGNLEILVVRQQYKVHELFAYIEDRELAKEIGWDVNGVVQAIINAMPETQSDASTSYDYFWLQQRIKDHDLYEGVRCSTVSVRHILVREFEGRVSHFIVEEYKGEPKRSARTNGSETDQQKRFLLQSINRFEEFNQAVAVFFLETSDGSWNGAQGLGHDIFSAMALKDRTKCAAIDLMFLRTGINLQAQNANAAQKANLIRFGPLNILPPGFNVQQATIMGDTQDPIAVDRYLDEVVSNNTGIYRQRQEKYTGNPRTAREVELSFQAQAILSNSMVNRFYTGLDKVYAEVYRRASSPNLSEKDTNRAVRMALEFQRRCKNRDVPMKAIVDVDSVEAYRNAGNGSIIMRQQNIAATMEFFPMLPEDGKQNFLNYALASINGQSMAELFNPRRNKQKLPNDQEALAMLENAAIKVGAPVQWTPSQNNVIHAQVHLQAGAEAANSLQQGGDPHEVAAFIEGIGQHVSVHLQELEKNVSRKNEFDILNDQWKQLGKLHDEIIQRVSQLDEQRQQQMQAQQRAQSITNGQDPNVAIKAAQAQVDSSIKLEKARLDMASKQQKFQQKDTAFRQGLAIADAKAGSEIMRQNAKAKAAKSKPE